MSNFFTPENAVDALSFLVAYRTNQRWLLEVPPPQPEPEPLDLAPLEALRAALLEGSRPELTSAKIIISGGRAMQSRENFTKYIEPVADKLGAAVGA